MQNKSLFIIFILLAFSASVYFFVFKKEDEESEQVLSDETKKLNVFSSDAVIPDIQVEPAPITNSPSNSQENPQIFDPYDSSDPSYMEIRKIAKNIARYPDQIAQIKLSDNVAISWLDGVDESLKSYITQHLQSQFATTSLSQVYIPYQLADNGLFVERMDDIIKFAKNIDNELRLGEDNLRIKINALYDFEEIAGWSLLPEFSEWIGRGFVYGSCQAKGFNKVRKTKECVTDQTRNFVKNDLLTIAENLKKASDELDQSVFDFSAKKMQQAGWKLIIY